MQPVNKVQLIEIAIPGTGSANTQTRVTFPDQPFLRTKYINSLEIYTSNEITTSPLGNAILSSAQLKTGYLSLYGQDPESQQSEGVWFQLVPLVDLHRIVNGTDPYVFHPYEIEPRQIQWEKSQFFFSAQLGNTAALSILLKVGYQNTF